MNQKTFLFYIIILSKLTSFSQSSKAIFNKFYYWLDIGEGYLVKANAAPMCVKVEILKTENNLVFGNAEKVIRNINLVVKISSFI